MSAEHDRIQLPGLKASRAYVDGWSILVNNNFDPAIDLERDTYGLMKPAGNKYALRHEIELYSCHAEKMQTQWIEHVGGPLQGGIF